MPRFRPVWGLVLALVACSSPPPAPDAGGLPPEVARAAADEASRRLDQDEAAELARAVAEGGVPSPTPELDALAATVAVTTSELRLVDVLSPVNAGAPPLRIRPGDLLELIVYGREEFSRAQRVSADGQLAVFLLGAVPVVGLTPDEAAARVRVGLEERFLRQADVSLLLGERAEATVKVFGQVRQPGAIVLPPERPLSVHALLALAGGLAADADGGRLALVRSGAEGRKVYHFSAQELLEAHLSGREVWLEPEDQLVVPRLPDVYLAGAVEKPGPVPLRPGSTVASLLFQAGGMSEQADARAIVVLGPHGLRPTTLEAGVAAREVVFVPRRERVYLIGAGVVKNGPLDLPRNGLTVVQAIAEAGWLTAHADLGDVEILRYQGGRQLRIPVPLDAILDGERSEVEFRLQPGDLVFVPETIW